MSLVVVLGQPVHTRRYEGRALDLIQGMKDGVRPHIRSSSGYEGLQKVKLITGRYERGAGKGRDLDLALPTSIPESRFQVATGQPNILVDGTGCQWVGVPHVYRRIHRYKPGHTHRPTSMC